MSGLPEATQLALEHLIRTASEDKVMVAGFAFSDNPNAVAAFGNCNDHAEIKLYELLCQFVRDKKRTGVVEEQLVKKTV